MKKEITIGLLFPGDMGIAIAEVLLSKNFRVVTAGEGRSGKTMANIQNSAVEDLFSLKEVVLHSDIILSVNSPNKSVEIAEEVCRYIAKSKNKPVFADLNSNTPESALILDGLFSSNNIIFINGAVLGSSKDMKKDAVIILSGENRKILTDLFDGIFNTKDAGCKIESASAYKLLFSLVNKGINAVFFEAMAGAAHYGIIDELNSSLQLYLPGTYQDLVKTTPTYAHHIDRRKHEMQGLSAMQKTEDLPNYISSAAAKIFETVSKSGIFQGTEPSDVAETFRLFKHFKTD